jgi:hypothetical protein
MIQPFDKLKAAMEYAKEQSKSGEHRRELILVVKQTFSKYLVTNKEELGRDDELVCTYMNGLKSIWQEKHIAYMRKAGKEEVPA